MSELKNVFDFNERDRLLAGTHQIDKAQVEGRKVLLFDDLYHSGATMNAISSALYDTGAVVDVVALTITKKQEQPMITKVFIGGSRRISKLDVAVQSRIDRMIEKCLPVIVGDANGADKAVQEYLRAKRYDLVEVFCSGDSCRNNRGGWPTRAVPVPRNGKRKDFGPASQCFLKCLFLRKVKLY